MTSFVQYAKNEMGRETSMVGISCILKSNALSIRSLNCYIQEQSRAHRKSSARAMAGEHERARENKDKIMGESVGEVIMKSGERGVIGREGDRLESR